MMQCFTGIMFQLKSHFNDLRRKENVNQFLQTFEFSFFVYTRCYEAQFLMPVFLTCTELRPPQAHKAASNCIDYIYLRFEVNYKLLSSHSGCVWITTNLITRFYIRWQMCHRSSSPSNHSNCDFFRLIRKQTSLICQVFRKKKKLSTKIISSWHHRKQTEKREALRC